MQENIMSVAIDREGFAHFGSTLAEAIRKANEANSK